MGRVFLGFWTQLLKGSRERQRVDVPRHAGARRFAACLALLLGAVAHAQTVRWQPSDSGLPNAVLLVFEDCEPVGSPQLPALQDVTFTFQGQSESTQMSFGTGGASRLRTVSLGYILRSRRNSPVQIPSFSVKTDKGVLTVPAFNAASPGAPLESVASAKLIPENPRVWAGEVFGLTYELSASRRTNPQISPTFEWNAAPLVAEDWSKPEVTEALVNGERRLNVVFRTRAIAKSPNNLKLEAASHLLSIQTGTIGFGIISQPRMEQVSVTSDQPTIEVRPLPAGAPASFKGAVGQFKLTSKIVPEKASVGEPVTWTIELSGSGNWPDIAGLPTREVSTDFQVVQPKAKRTPAEGKLFDVTLSEDVVLVPTKAGNYALGPVAFSYFDPKTGAYKTVSTPRTMVTISAPNTPQFNLGPAASATEPPIEPATKSKSSTPPTVPPPPAGIPREPLPGTANAWAPLSTMTVLVTVSAPFAAVLIFWFSLAVRRAKQTDPIRPRREARDRLAQTLAHLGNAPESDRTELLRAWQRDTAVLWQLSHAAPPATALPDSTWRALWSEADRSLYGAKTALPTDWTARAQEALAAKSVPGFKPLRLFLPQNLMPFAALLAVTCAVSVTLLHAAETDPLAAYRKGDFTGAEKSWRARLAVTPTDWIARHNLSLALAQQDRAGEAAAQAAAAFVQHPSDAAVRWHFALAAEKAGSAPQSLAGFISPGPLQLIGRVASPVQWQIGTIAAAWIAAVALGWILFNTYGRRAARAKWSAVFLLFFSIVLAGFSAAGTASYGMAGKFDAVLIARPSTLRSIPTDADTTQKTSPLAIGSIALAHRTPFLGWTRLSFENGQTGWVRTDDLVPLWR